MDQVASCRGLAIKTDYLGANLLAAERRALIHVSSPEIAMAYDQRCQWPLTTTRADGNAMNRIIYIVGFVVIVLFILGFLGLR